MKVTIFNGSPRGVNSNTHHIAKALLSGAHKGGAQTEEVFLVEKDIKHCQGCMACWQETPGECALKDDMAKLLEKHLESDYVGLATPVYGLYMTGMMKNFTDRFLPLSTPFIHKDKDGSFYHEGRHYRLPRQFFIANSGFPGDHNFDLLQAVVQYLNPVVEIYRNCGEALQTTQDEDPELFERIEKYKKALKQAGYEMVTTGEVQESTLAQIQEPIISDEEYMSGANQMFDEKISQI